MSIVADLVALLGADAVIAGDDLDRTVSYWDSSPANALALVRPDSTAGVSALLRFCHERGQPVVTIGGATNCVQAADPDAGEVILSTERLTDIESLDPVQSVATVSAGVRLADLQAACAGIGMMFPLDLGARGSCTIGGNIATNAGGINVLRFGMMRQLVLGLEVVLADGTILSSLNSMLKNNSAYDLKQLFIGTEGTLGIVTRAVVRLFPASLSRQTALLGLDSFGALTTLLTAARTGLGNDLSAFEVMWGDYYRGVTGTDGHAPPMAREWSYYVIIETEGREPEADADHFMAFLNRHLEEGDIGDAIVVQSERERQSIWQVREEFDPIANNKPCFLYDVSLPIPRMAGYVDTVKDRLAACGGRLYVLGHIADGNLHFFVHMPSDKNLTEAEQHQQVNEIVYGELAPFRGAVSAEHGIGCEKQAWLSVSRTAEEIALMTTLKHTLDPKKILNRGRVLPEGQAG